MDRRVQCELLDHLDPGEPRARRSRRDLQRINAWMGNARVLALALKCSCGRRQPASLVELGAGDGTLLLRVAQRLGWRGVRAILVDTQPVICDPTFRAFAKLGWVVESVQGDAMDWLASRSQRTCPGAIVCNLFLHHLPDAQLAELLALASQKTDLLVASEPRRCARGLLFSRLVALIGCNAVTRHDAPTSVRAGFAGRELSRLWRADGGWVTQERAAGLFGHLFAAQLRG